MPDSVIALPQKGRIKVKNSNGGGNTDGGVVCIVQDLVYGSGVEMGPPPGKAWRAPVTGFQEETETSGFLSVQNFDTVAGAEVYQQIILGDGTPLGGIPAVGATVVGPETWDELDNNAFVGGVALAYPQKVRHTLFAGMQPKPTRPVRVRAVWIEFDLPGPEALQIRGGNNVGVEPACLPLYQDLDSQPVKINVPQGGTILEGVGVSAVGQLAILGQGMFHALPSNANDVQIDVFFEDQNGLRIPIDQVVLSPDENNEFEPSVPYCLAEGEKFVIATSTFIPV